ncbi:ABC transporter ATP-binding protein [Methanofollis fontis]|uniref:Molybdate/tungstate import ATP-binding protein WtpC n=1 Tax=Methanofollis fontis TaxID=2052832 RepID=A0A483CP77_9EURY|nr:ABC transporter ATP-binding protein [Methanofollis fontis]TAJ44505.1 molybdenum ABC transporter ATP-binding protein [Methanofollis fontis]
MIEFRHVSLSLGAFSLRDVSLQIHEGDYYFIIGPSGAGKTVILESIAGLHLPDSGSVLIGGEDASSVPPERRRVTLVYQDYSLFPHMTVEQNIGFGLRMQRMDKGLIRERVDALLSQFGIAHLRDRYPGTMSGGEQQRVAIARALAVEPEILLLDEPFAALDPVTRESLMSDLQQIHQERRLTIVQVTHAREETLRLATRLAVIIDGSLVQEDVTGVVFEAPHSTAVARFVGMENILHGTVETNVEGLATIRVGNRTIEAVTDIVPGSTVDVVFRAADVTLSRTDCTDVSARNQFEGGITAVVPMGGPLTEVRLDVGFPVTALVTSRSAEEGELRPGMRVTISVKASAVHVIPDGA